MSDRVILSIKDDETHAQSFVLVVHAPKDPTNPSGIPSDDGMKGPWRAQLTDARFTSKFSHTATICTANDSNARVINERWQGRIEFQDDLAELVFFKFLITGKSRDRVRDIHADWKLNQIVPPEASKLVLHEQLPLKPYQQVGTICSTMLPGYALLCEQGVGKTPMVVTRVCHDAMKLRASGETRMYRTLITCPKNVRANWAREFSRFSTCKGKVTVMRRGEIGRIRELATAMSQFNDEQFTVVIISFGLLVNAWDTLLQHVDWDLGVVDELHGIKWHQTDRTQYCWRMRDRCKSRMGLTGTPIVNSALDLFAQLEFLEKGLSGFGTFKDFREKYGVFAKSAEGRDVMTHVQNMPQLKKRLSEVAFIVRKDEVLKDLPPKVYDILEVELTPRQQRDYDSLASQYILEIEKDLEDATTEGKYEMVVNNALVKLMKLAQITSGFLNVPEERDEFGDIIQEATQIHYKPNPKLNQLIEILKEHALSSPMEKVLIWTCYKHDVAIICDALNANGMKHVRYEGATSDHDRAEAERLFNSDPATRWCVGNAAAGGVGLNMVGYNWWDPPEKHLPTNTAWSLYYSVSHKPVDRWQSEDRNHRTGTRCTVRVTDLVVPQTIDEDIRVRITDKKKHALDVQDLRDIMMNIVKRRGER